MLERLKIEIQDSETSIHYRSEIEIGNSILAVVLVTITLISDALSRLLNCIDIMLTKNYVVHDAAFANT